MEALSELSFTHYRMFAEMGGLIDFYQAASQVNELMQSKTRSRPARCVDANSLDDLRAKPLEDEYNRPVYTISALSESERLCEKIPGKKAATTFAMSAFLVNLLTSSTA